MVHPSEATVSTHRCLISSRWFQYKSPLLLITSFRAGKSTELKIYPVSQQVCEYFEILEVRSQLAGIILIILRKSLLKYSLKNASLAKLGAEIIEKQ